MQLFLKKNFKVYPLSPKGFVLQLVCKASVNQCCCNQREIYNNFTNSVLQQQSQSIFTSSIRYKQEYRIQASTEPSLQNLPTECVGQVTIKYKGGFKIEPLKYLEEANQKPPNIELLCQSKRMLFKTDQIIVVGDMVQVSNVDWTKKYGLITKLFERTNFLQRPQVANIDQVLVNFATTQPEFQPTLLSRFLVGAELSGAKVKVILNKMDLVASDIMDSQMKLVSSWGYDVIPCSIKNEEALNNLQDTFRNQISVIMGPSGTGKSSIINAFKKLSLQRRAESGSEDRYLDETDLNSLQKLHDHTEQDQLTENLESKIQSDEPNLPNYNRRHRKDINQHTSSQEEFLQAGVETETGLKNYERNFKRNNLNSNMVDVHDNPRKYGGADSLNVNFKQQLKQEKEAGQQLGTQLGHQQEAGDIVKFRKQLQEQMQNKNEDQNNQPLASPKIEQNEINQSLDKEVKNQNEQFQYQQQLKQTVSDRQLRDQSQNSAGVQMGNVKDFNQIQENDKTVNLRELKSRGNQIEEQQISPSGKVGVVQGHKAEDKSDANELEGRVEGEEEELDGIQDRMYTTERVADTTRRGGGRHTTRTVKLIALPQGGFLVDSPGFSDNQLDEVNPEELQYFFPEIRTKMRQGSCKFKDCLHLKEPGCVVNEEPWDRQHHYALLYDEVKARQEEMKRKGLFRKSNLTTTKQKVKKGGVMTEEYKLDPKKYQRVSRSKEANRESQRIKEEE